MNRPLHNALWGAALLTGGALAADAFAMEELAQGYMLSPAQASAPAEGRCGEGNCGVGIPDTNKDGRVSPEEFAAAWPAEADRFSQADRNGDGYIDTDEMKAYHASTPPAPHGEAAKASEGKCGEGKCGEGGCGAKK